MRNHYKLEISKQYLADLTTIKQLKFLYSCSISVPIVEFIISEISSFVKDRNLKYMLRIVLKE